MSVVVTVVVMLWFLAVVVVLACTCRHRWYRPGDDWRERKCLKCGELQYLVHRTWERF